MEQQQTTDLMDFDPLLNNFSADDLYQSFFQESNALPSPNSPFSSTDADYFSHLEPLPSPLLPNNVFIKPDPESPQFTEKKRRIEEYHYPQTTEVQTTQEIKPERSTRAKKERDEKYLRRLAANKKSAQASRERKKQLKTQLEHKVEEISKEKRKLETVITQLETENQVLKGEFIQLQRLISESAVLSKLMARAASVSLAKSDDERMQKELELKQEIAKSNPSEDILSSNGNAAAFMYMMIILQSFGPHFANLQPQYPSLSLPTPLAVM